MCGRITATFEFSDIRVRWNLERAGDVSEVAESERSPAVVSGSIGGFHSPIASINRIQNKKAL
jgi:hypothetical protein